ncbi:hypothetical protein SODG_001807 [Sodalis praecaptivus]
MMIISYQTVLFPIIFQWRHILMDSATSDCLNRPIADRAMLHTFPCLPNETIQTRVNARNHRQE